MTKTQKLSMNMGRTKEKKLSKLAVEIRTISINIKSEMYQIGELLVRAKKIIGHGNFEDWVTRSFDFSYQTNQYSILP